jgi:hypothetical protein
LEIVQFQKNVQILKIVCSEKCSVFFFLKLFDFSKVSDLKYFPNTKKRIQGKKMRKGGRASCQATSGRPMKWLLKRGGAWIPQ